MTYRYGEPGATYGEPGATYGDWNLDEEPPAEEEPRAAGPFRRPSSEWRKPLPPPVIRIESRRDLVVDLDLDITAELTPAAVELATAIEAGVSITCRQVAPACHLEPALSIAAPVTVDVVTRIAEDDLDLLLLT